MLPVRTECKQTMLPVIILGTQPSGGIKEKHQPVAFHTHTGKF
jgi:hypothetical protein